MKGWSYGQVGVRMKGGLEASTYYCLQYHGADPTLCFLKLDIHIAFNKYNRSIFLKACLPELFGWTLCSRGRMHHKDVCGIAK